MTFDDWLAEPYEYPEYEDDEPECCEGCGNLVEDCICEQLARDASEPKCEHGAGPDIYCCHCDSDPY